MEGLAAKSFVLPFLYSYSSLVDGKKCPQQSTVTAPTVTSNRPRFCEKQNSKEEDTLRFLHSCQQDCMLLPYTHVDRV